MLESAGPRRCGRALGLPLVLLLATTAGCAKPVSVKRVDPETVHRELTRNVLSTGRPSADSIRYLTRDDLSERFGPHPAETLAQMHADLAPEGDADRLFALAELSFLHGRNAGGAPYHLASALYAWAFLFPESGSPPDSLDPRVRLAADLYNRGLTKGLATSDGSRVDLSPRVLPLPFGSLALQAPQDEFEWNGLRVTDFVPAADYEVRGLRSRYRLPGLGAPLVSRVERVTPDAPWPPEARHIARRMRIPATAIVRLPGLRAALASGAVSGELDLIRGVDTLAVEIGGRTVPIEIEWSVALAYMLEHSRLADYEYKGFFAGDLDLEERPEEGLIFLQPHLPGRVPIVLVHGTASSPARWAELLNELFADPSLRGRIEVWLFRYNTGNPIAYSAGLMRRALVSRVAELDPQGRDPALQRMVVIGHSQGGLLTKMMATSSGDAFWNNLTSVPLDDLELSEQTREILRTSLFFEALPFVRRVIFVATPHRGSFLANWRLSELVKRVTRLTLRTATLVPDMLSRNPGVWTERSFERLPTSVDNMSPNNAFLVSLGTREIAPGVSAHSIIAVRGSGSLEQLDDGVVGYESAHLPGVESELVVQSSHSVQGHPRAIQEIRRILRLHLATP